MQKVSSFAFITWGKGDPSLSIAIKGRSSMFVSICLSCLFLESVASFTSRFIVTLRIDSERRLGIQPKGPMAITPQTWDATSVRAPPTVRMASPPRYGEMKGEALLIIDFYII